jgi:4-cresol dehydrogenase (hydroxylating)
LKRSSNLGAFIDVLARLKHEGVMSTVTHIGNKARTHASLMYGISTYLQTQCGVPVAELEQEANQALATVAPFEWTSLGGVSGTARQVSAAVAEVKARVSHLARVTLVDEAKLDLGYRLMHFLKFWPFARANAAAIAAIRPLNGLASGVPSDVAIDNLLWRFGRGDLSATALDASDCGLLYVSPALPMDGDFVADVVQMLTALAAEHGHALYVTVNIETSTSLVAIINLLFNRAVAEEVERAQRCAAALHAAIRSRGLEVYRARADMMSAVVDDTSDYWSTVRRLKAALDPNNIIAPGRYNIAL